MNPDGADAEPIRPLQEGLQADHVEPDWLLIYTVGGDWIRFERTGTHADLFD